MPFFFRLTPTLTANTDFFQKSSGGRVVQQSSIQWFIIVCGKTLCVCGFYACRHFKWMDVTNNYFSYAAKIDICNETFPSFFVCHFKLVVYCVLFSFRHIIQSSRNFSLIHSYVHKLGRKHLDWLLTWSTQFLVLVSYYNICILKIDTT